MKVPATPSNQCMFWGRRNNGNILKYMSPSSYKHFWGLGEVQERWGILDVSLSRLKAQRSWVGALQSVSSAARGRLVEAGSFFRRYLRTLQAQLWGYWAFDVPTSTGWAGRHLDFCKTHSKLEATQQPSSKSPQQSWEAQQHNWMCSQVTAIFLLVCMSTGTTYTSCWLPPPALITNCVSAVGLPVGSWGKTWSLAASHPTFYPQAAGTLMNTRGLVELGSCGGAESLHSLSLCTFVC